MPPKAAAEKKPASKAPAKGKFWILSWIQRADTRQLPRRRRRPARRPLPLARKRRERRRARRHTLLTSIKV